MKHHVMLKKLLITLLEVYRHPRSRGLGTVARWAAKQAGARLLQENTICTEIMGCRFLVPACAKGSHIYLTADGCTMEQSCIEYLLKVLEPGDTFVDVGAHIGIYSVLVAAKTEAIVHSFEPNHHSFDYLKSNVKLNIGKVITYRCALGIMRTNLRMTNYLGTENRIDYYGNSEVEVYPLDHYGLKPAAIKIDTEGWEQQVLGGAQQTLRYPGLKTLILETDGLGAKHGFDESQICRDLAALGFKPMQVNGEPVKIFRRA
jgi:FkbM family methyltransferase